MVSYSKRMRLILLASLFVSSLSAFALPRTEVPNRNIVNKTSPKSSKLQSPQQFIVGLSLRSKAGVGAHRKLRTAIRHLAKIMRRKGFILSRQGRRIYRPLFRGHFHNVLGSGQTGIEVSEAALERLSKRLNERSSGRWQLPLQIIQSGNIPDPTYVVVLSLRRGSAQAAVDFLNGVNDELILRGGGVIQYAYINTVLDTSGDVPTTADYISIGAEPKAHRNGLDLTNSYLSFLSESGDFNVDLGRLQPHIAVIDTGAELNHPDLTQNLWENDAEVNGIPGVDDDLNGVVDDFHGADFFDLEGAGLSYFLCSQSSVTAFCCPDYEDCTGRDADPTDIHGHGTQVCGIAAARTNNGIGTAGNCPLCKFIPVRAGGQFVDRDTGQPLEEGKILLSDAVEALYYATLSGADVINLSFGTNCEANAAVFVEAQPQFGGQSILDFIASQLSVLLVGASGNGQAYCGSEFQGFFPASFPQVMAVAAVDSVGALTSYSTVGEYVEIAGFGGVDTGGVFSDDAAVVPTVGGSGPGDDSSHYRAFYGTSFAAPQIAGAAALVMSRNPYLSANQVREILNVTSQALQDGGGSFGYLDTHAALKKAMPFDLDYDCDVDFDDFNIFAANWTGPGGDTGFTGVSIADIDADGDVDFADYSYFQICYEQTCESYSANTDFSLEVGQLCSVPTP